MSKVTDPRYPAPSRERPKAHDNVRSVGRRETPTQSPVIISHTISDDQSEDSDFKKRLLVAASGGLQDKKEDRGQPHSVTPSTTRPANGSTYSAHGRQRSRNEIHPRSPPRFLPYYPGPSRNDTDVVDVGYPYASRPADPQREHQQPLAARRELPRRDLNSNTSADQDSGFYVSPTARSMEFKTLGSRSTLQPNEPLRALSRDSSSTASESGDSEILEEISFRGSDGLVKQQPNVIPNSGPDTQAASDMQYQEGSDGRDVQEIGRCNNEKTGEGNDSNDLSSSHTKSDSEHNLLADKLRDSELRIQQLIFENEQMKIALSRKQPDRYEKPKSLTVYRTTRTDNKNGEAPKLVVDMYLGQPRAVVEDDGTSHLVFSSPISNWNVFLERNKKKCFIVFKDYLTESLGSSNTKSGVEHDIIKPFKQSIFPISRALRKAIDTLLKSEPSLRTLEYDFARGHEIKAPYLCIYHTLETFNPHEHRLEPEAIEHFKFMLQRINQDFGAEYANVGSLLSRGLITQNTLAYLFRPGDILVSRTNQSYCGTTLTHWPMFRDRNSTLNESICHLDLSSWSFNSKFRKVMTVPSLSLPNNVPEEFAITQLQHYPVQYATDDIKARLRRRGLRLWSCRFRRFVTYRPPANDYTRSSASEDGERYMVDVQTYMELHDSDNVPIIGDLTASQMKGPNPPSDEFLMTQPLYVKGFNLREKKWHDLMIDYISDVRWDKQIFNNLVLSDKSKKIIRALVSKQASTRRSTDLVKGKGDGLIILLHGGPGTGKTLTAESIAELVEKPLYRVTCGDIGTDPSQVERYLESVFYFGKIWGCVILLDEADVFLQERNLQDLQRNALVAVFLRVLEYHEGILFLTSNRIGIFDEAFRSRIQLSLHYRTLEVPERKKVWRNFFKHLQQGSGEEEHTDFDDLYDHVDMLAEAQLNGRQIRNSITLARQVAHFDGVKLTHEQLEDVIKLAADFDQYVNRTQDMTDEEKMHERGLRAP